MLPPTSSIWDSLTWPRNCKVQQRRICINLSCASVQDEPKMIPSLTNSSTANEIHWHPRSCSRKADYVSKIQTDNIRPPNHALQPEPCMQATASIKPANLSRSSLATFGMRARNQRKNNHPTRQKTQATSLTWPRNCNLAGFKHTFRVLTWNVNLSRKMWLSFWPPHLHRYLQTTIAFDHSPTNRHSKRNVSSNNPIRDVIYPYIYIYIQGTLKFSHGSVAHSCNGSAAATSAATRLLPSPALSQGFCWRFWSITLHAWCSEQPYKNQGCRWIPYKRTFDNMLHIHAYPGNPQVQPGVCRTLLQWRRCNLYSNTLHVITSLITGILLAVLIHHTACMMFRAALQEPRLQVNPLQKDIWKYVAYPGNPQVQPGVCRTLLQWRRCNLYSNTLHVITGLITGILLAVLIHYTTCMMFRAALQEPRLQVNPLQKDIWQYVEYPCISREPSSADRGLSRSPAMAPLQPLQQHPSRHHQPYHRDSAGIFWSITLHAWCSEQPYKNQGCRWIPYKRTFDNMLHIHAYPGNPQVQPGVCRAVLQWRRCNLYSNTLPVITAITAITIITSLSWVPFQSTVLCLV